MVSYSVNYICEKSKPQKVEPERGIETVESVVLEPRNSFVRQPSQYKGQEYMTTRRRSIGYYNNNNSNIMFDGSKPPIINNPHNAGMPSPIVRSQSFVMPQQQKPIYHQYTLPPMNTNMYPQKSPVLMHLQPQNQNQNQQQFYQQSMQQCSDSQLHLVTNGLPNSIRRANSQPQLRGEMLESPIEKGDISLNTKELSPNIQPSTLSPNSPMSPINEQNSIRHSKSLPIYNRSSAIDSEQIPPSIVPGPDNQQYETAKDFNKNDINGQIVAKNENHEFHKLERQSVYLPEIKF